MDYINTLSSAGCLACQQAIKKLRILYISSRLMPVEIGQTQLQLVMSLLASDTHLKQQIQVMGRLGGLNSARNY